MTLDQTNSCSSEKKWDVGLLLTIPEVAHRLRLKESTIRKMIFERRIDTVRPSPRSVRIPEGAVKKILENGFQKALNISEL